MTCLFISHSSRNNDKAIAMRDWLAENGWDDVFLDLDPHTGLAPGENWRQALRAAADRCQAVLCVITPEWRASNWCFNEFLLAKQLGKRVFPIIVGDIDLDSLQDELTANIQAVDVVHDPQGWVRLKEGLIRAGLDPASFPFPPGRRPYPGFEPLTEEDAAIFFGREAQIVRGLDRLRAMSEAGAERMLVILGASGAGKSSYLRAGLWPRLKRDDRNFMLLPTIRPERGALSGKFGLQAALEFTFAEARVSDQALIQEIPRSRATIGHLLDADPNALCRLLADLRAARISTLINNKGASPEIVIPIDQGEELFNEEGREEAGRFMDLLATTMANDQRVIVILALRSDSFPRLQSEPRLASVGKAPFDLPPLPVGSMRLVIEGPARVAKPPVKLDPELVDALLSDSAGQDTLPLLAFTLGRLLQEYGAEGKLTLAQYDRLGRVNGAVNATVSEVLDGGRRLGALPRDKASLDALLRQTFIPHLARVNKASQFVRRVATKAELPARSVALIDLFVDAHLLLLDRRTASDGDVDIIEVAHEALLREWTALRSWLEADREFLIGKDQLAEDIDNWRNVEGNQKADALLGGFKLSRAKQWLTERRTEDFNREEREFIRASIARDDAAKRRRRQLRAAAFCILLGFTSAAVWEWRQAASARNIAEDRLNIARGSAEDLVRWIATDLRKVRGIQTNTLERLLETAKASFEKLTSAVGGDPAFQQRRAEMMSNFGETFLKAGDLTKANDFYSQSLEIYSRLAAKEGDTNAWQRGVADQIDHIGVVRQQQGNLADASTHFNQAFNMRLAGAKREPNNVVSYRDLASSYYNIGEVALPQGSPKEALANQQMALANIERALSLDTGNPDLELQQSLILISLGTTHEVLDQNDERLANNLKALAIRQRLAASDRDNAEWQRMLSWAYAWVGGSYADVENWLPALENYQQCLILRQKLAKDDPGDMRAKYDLAWGYHLTAAVLQAVGRLSDAADDSTEAFNIRKELAATDEANKRWRKDLALSYISLGDLAVEQGNAQAAIGHFEAARAIFDKLTTESPTDTSWRQNLALVSNKLARALKLAGDLDRALVRYEQALMIRNHLLAENPDSLSLMANAATSEYLVGDLLQHRDEPAQAIEHFRKSRDLRKVIVMRKTGNKNAQDELDNVERAIASLSDQAQER